MVGYCAAGTPHCCWFDQFAQSCDDPNGPGFPKLWVCQSVGDANALPGPPKLVTPVWGALVAGAGAGVVFAPGWATGAIGFIAVEVW